MIAQHGKLVVTEDEIILTGFTFEGGNPLATRCALTWAILRLAQALDENIEEELVVIGGTAKDAPA